MAAFGSSPGLGRQPHLGPLPGLGLERGQGQRLLIAVNYGPTQGQCQVSLPWDDVRGKQVILHDLVSEISYERVGDDLLTQGLYVDLPAWGFHVFAG